METTILVIDDEPSNIQVIISILKNSGFKYKVFSSSSSTLGLEIAVQTKPNIIITDWEMPDMNGIELILELKKNPQTSEIPIIMATGVNMSSADLNLALESGAFDFIRKPIDSIELIARTNTALRFIKYYEQKLEHKREIIKIKEEKFAAELDAKKRELVSKTLILSQVNELWEKYQENLGKIKCDVAKTECNFIKMSKNLADEMLAKTNQQIWSELKLHFEQINETFYKNITETFPSLTQNERKLCAYLRLNLNTKEIAQLTNQTHRAIEIARIRLRQKFGLTGTEEDLHTFLLKF